MPATVTVFRNAVSRETSQHAVHYLRSTSRSISVGADGTTLVDYPLVPYPEISKLWPSCGRHVLAYHDDEGVVVYQAFNAAIAKYAVEHQGFLNCPYYSISRMTWIKTNFMWMMYRCGWGIKDHNQERILALKITHHGMRNILSCASRKGGTRESTVRLQWDPDHDPSGATLKRQAIQLGLKGQVAKDFAEKYLLRVEDVTETLVRTQWPHVLPKAAHWMRRNKSHALTQQLWTPTQREAWNLYLAAAPEKESPEASLAKGGHTSDTQEVMAMFGEVLCPAERVYPLDPEIANHLDMN